MNITKNIWRVENHKFTFGCIIEYNNDCWFVYLTNKTDEESFEQFINEEDINSPYVAENTLHEKFCVEDYDPNHYSYYYNDGNLTPYKREVK